MPADRATDTPLLAPSGLPNLLAAAIAALAISTACTPGPEPIQAGADRCARCAMIIADARFAGEAITRDAVRKYDDIAEIRLDAAEGRLGPPGTAMVYLTDFDSGKLLPGDETFVLQSPDLRTPMGGGAIAFGSRASAAEFARSRRLENVRISPFKDWWTLGRR